MRVEDDSYYMVGYNAALSGKPVPTKEVEALLFLTKDNLKLFNRLDVVTVDDIIQQGGEILEQPGVHIPRESILAPHGTALYLVRRLGMPQNRLLDHWDHKTASIWAKSPKS